MILVALNGAADAIQVRGGVVVAVGNALLLLRAVAVRFDIGLIQHVEAILVAQLVPFGHIGIVAGADGVDVVLLHQRDVLNHPLARDHLAVIRIEFVPVHTLEHQLLAIEQHLIASDLRLPEADAPRNGLDHVAGGIFQGDQQCVEIRRLGRPLLRIANALGELNRKLFA